MSPRSLYHKRTYFTIGAHVSTPLGERLKEAARLHGKTTGAWLREAAIEKLERDNAPSIIPEREDA